ncbi:NAD-dependent epimerase/dehydratase family protein [Riemerella columbina]|uniref:NAD-dependent epimerase/dehydratase family protein n=1 Tax=Riemerella columbina TaxID=103810 RepID=UPI000363FDBE|nr:NAD-dependent epimerase/dehydratase family protein [Riemerella columbina]
MNQNSNYHTVLVTGGTGILGSMLLLKLLEKGYHVKATYRKNSVKESVMDIFKYYTDNSEILYKKIDWVAVDFEDLDSLRQAFSGVDAIYHCAGTVSFNPNDKKALYNTNITGTKNCLYIADELKVKKFLFVSSIAVLDSINEHGMIDEESHFNPKISHSDYAISKHLAEMEVWRASAEGMQVIIINPGVIIGSGNWKQSSGALFSRLKTLPYSFIGCTGYVDVRDVANIAIQLMDGPHADERFIVVAENQSYIDLANQVRQKLNLKPAEQLPKFWLNIGGALNTALGWLIPPLKWLSKPNRMAITECVPISNNKVKTALGYTFIPLEDSIDFHLKHYIADQN